MKKNNINYQALVISLSVTLVGLTVSVLYFETLTPAICLKRLGLPLFRLLGVIFIGLLVGQMIEILGWTRHVAIIARPFFNFSHLGDRCSAAFTTAFISGATSNAMLLDFYQDQKINKTQLFLSNYINQFPAYFLHLPTTVFIVLPLTGTAGILYFILTFAAVLFRTFCFLLVGKFYLKTTSSNAEKTFQYTTDREQPIKTIGEVKEKPEWSTIISTIKQRLPGRIINISIWVLPIYSLVFILNINGFFDYLNTSLSKYITLTLMPVESLSVVVLSFAAEFTSGFAAAGALMNAGVITVKQTVIALLLGNVLAFPIRALRHQLPRYMGIFSPKMGLQLLLSGQIFRVISIVLIGTLYYWVG
ncbi:MAG: nucleoside recognition protein [Pseudomonadota bacterium]